LASVLMLGFYITFELVMALAVCNMFGWTSIDTDLLWSILLLGGIGLAIVSMLFHSYITPPREMT